MVNINHQAGAKIMEKTIVRIFDYEMFGYFAEYNGCTKPGL